MLHNMGNLESGCGRYKEAMDYYTRAIKIRIALADSASLGFTYLCMGRLYYLQGMYEEAIKTLANSEELFIKASCGGVQFMIMA